MPTDVIIDPSSGQIYWNDGTGSPQSISLGGNAQDTISVTGYGAVFTPGSTVGGTTVLVRFKDSALETLAPGTNGYELGSSTLRWKLFATTGNFSDSTNSTSLTSGAFQIQGGIAVSGNASFGQSVLFWTPGGANYIGFRAPASAGNTTYVLPSAAPISGGTGTSVLSSDQTGILSWVPMVAGGAGGGSSTISIVTAGINPTLHPVLFTPTQGTSAAAAVSSNTTLLYSPSTETFYVSGILVTSTTVSSNQGTGAILIAGGMGVSGQINAASMQIAGNAVISGNLTFNGVGVFGNATSDTITSLARYASDLLPSTDNSHDFGTSALGWRNTYFSGIGTFAGALRVTSSTTSISTSTGAFSVTGGVGIGGSLYVTTSVPSNISGFYVFNGVLSGTAITTPSVTATNIRTTASTLNIVDSGTTNTVLQYNGTRFGVLIAANSTSSSDGGLVTTGGAGFGGSINVNGNIGVRSGFELRIFNPADNAYTGFDFTGSASTTYILPPASPAIGNSVLQSTTGGVMSWVPMATGSGSPAGNNTELQFNNGGTFGGATGITYQSTSYLVSIASTADQRAVTTVGLRLVNNATVSVAGVQQRFSPAFEIAGKTVTTPATENFNRFLTEVVGTINSYGAQQQWKYSLDTGTPTYSNPIFVIHSQKGVGIGYSAITFQNFFRASATQAIELTYVLPVAYPGTGTSVLSSNTTGDLSWVPMTAGGSGTPGGSNRQIQYNNSTTFGGASGFEYVSAGNAVTVNIFATAGGGSTSGLSINTINGTTTRIGIGLTNPAFELEIRGELSATNKSFVIDHPTKPGMKLRYGSLEGPENGVYVRGQLLGTNIIETPDYWRGLVHDDSCTIHLTPIGNYQQLYVEKIQDYKVYVGTASTFEINCFYSVWAERKDISKLNVEY